MAFLRFSLSRRVLLVMAVFGLAAILASCWVPALAPARDAPLRHARASAGAVSTWRILLLIYRQTDADYVDLSGVTRHLQADLPQSDIDALLAAMSGSIAPAVRVWSNNQAAWDVEVRYPSRPISRVATLGTRSRWVDPSCISADIAEYFKPDYYDHVMVYWRSSDDEGNAIPSDGWGWSSRSYSPSYGYATVTYPGETLWNPAVADMGTQIWIHEWLHSVSWFYADLGYHMPLYDADGAAAPDYYPDKQPYPGWGSFYADLMNDRVLQGGVNTGIPAEAWARGTIKGPNDTTDHAPPVTTVSGNDDAWHSQPVELTFAAVDNAGGSGMSGGLAKTEYKLDNAPWTPGATLTVPAPLNTKVTHTTLYRSMDAAGNLEEAKSCTVRIDTTAPSPPADIVAPQTTASGADMGWHSAPVTVTFSASDPTPNASGVAYTEYRLDGGAWTRGTQIVLPAPPATKATHTIGYRSADLAGNVEAEKTCQVMIDTIGSPTPSDKTSPVTTVHGADDAWHADPVRLTLTAVPAAGGLPVAYSESRLGDGTWTRGISVVVPASADHSSDGIQTIGYRSADSAVPPTVEDAHTCLVKIDTTGPTAVAIANLTVRRGRAANFRFRVNDALPSGVALSPTATVRVVIESSRFKTVKRLTLGARATNAPLSYAWICGLKKGSYRFRIYATDEAGNAQGSVGRGKLTVR